MSLINLTGLSRRLDCAVPTVKSRVASGAIQPVATDTRGRLLFDASKLDQYRALFHRGKSAQ